MTPHDRLSRSLGGVTVVTVTPFQQDYELDLDGLRSNVEWLATSGVDANTSCGGTGEYLSLTATEMSAVTQAIVSASNGRVPHPLGWAFVYGTAEMRAEAYWRLGGRGFTSGIANFAPTLSMCLRDAFENSDGAQISRYRKQAGPLEQLRSEGGGAYNIAAVKEAMALCGLAAGPVRPPGADLSEEPRPLVRRFVQSLPAACCHQTSRTSGHDTGGPQSAIMSGQQP